MPSLRESSACWAPPTKIWRDASRFRAARSTTGSTPSRSSPRPSRQGRDLADAAVIQKLYSRAMGFTKEIKKHVLYRGELREIPMTLYYPPDIQACFFWLRNRRRRDWQEKGRARAGRRPDHQRARGRLRAGAAGRDQGRRQAPTTTMSENDGDMQRDIGKFRRDPLGFVRYAFPWGRPARRWPTKPVRSRGNARCWSSSGRG